MKIFKAIKVGSRSHVVCGATPRGNFSTGEKIPDANYLGSGVALCGVLKKGESLEEFKIRTGKN